MNKITTTAAPGGSRGRLPRCLPMRLWKNAAATILTGLIITAWAVFLNGTRPGLTARGTTAVVLVLGIGVWVLYAWSIGTESRLATAFSGPCGWHDSTVAGRDGIHHHPPREPGACTGAPGAR
jgi:hypothetical protein